MSRSAESPPSSRRRTIKTAIGVVVLLALAGLLFSLHGRAARAAAKTGDQLMKQQQPSEALTWYEVSHTLGPGDPAVSTKIAAIELSDGRAALAQKALAPALKHPTTAVWLLDSQIELELGDTNAAIGAAQKANATEQLGLALATAGQDTALTKLVATLPAGQLNNELAGAGYSRAYLAEVLYQRGLPATANRVLAKLSPATAQTDLLRAVVTLKLGRGSKTSLEAAQGYLNQAVTLNPSNVDLRQALEAVDLKLGDKAAAADQAAKITALKSGKV